MLNLEEYIARRKKEDNLNELDPEHRSENLKACVNYVFEYFNDYIGVSIEDNTVLQEEKIRKYRKQVRGYDPEIRDWLVMLYSDHGNQVNRSVIKVLEENEYFFLFNTDQEFRSISYDCYSKLIKRYPFLRSQEEMLFLFIKNYHQLESEQRRKFEFPMISERVNGWIEETWNKHHVNVVAFAEDWTMNFWDHEDMWPASHRTKSLEAYRKYEYNFKQKSNLFNLEWLYAKMPKKSFTRGRKQEFEILMMYFWLHQIVGDDEGYWQDYLESVIPGMSEA